MLKVWFVILASLNADGTLNADLKYPLDPKFNNEKSCQESGQALADQLQLELGTTNSKVFFLCTSIPMDELQKLDKGI